MELKLLEYKDYIKFLKIYEEASNILDDEKARIKTPTNELEVLEQNDIQRRIDDATKIIVESSERLFGHLILQELYRLAPDDVVETLNKTKQDLDSLV